MNWGDKTVLLIGGTGSFGSAFVGCLEGRYKPKALRIFSRDEHKQTQLLNTYAGVGDGNNVSGFIGDIRDKSRLMMAMQGVDVVIHAAALKQVQSCEYNPFETIKTNVLGSMNIIECALAHNVEKVLAISTDKAAAPLNLYGASKMCMERLFVHANNYRGVSKRTKFSCTRYGNVADSRGTIVPVWREILAKKGVISITNPKATRFWIKMSAANKFVLDVLDAMDDLDGGEIFVPRMPSVNIMTVYQAITDGVTTFHVIGDRIGDKLHETLILAEEIKHTVEIDLGYIVCPENPHWSYARPKGTLPGYMDGYRSDNNVQFLNKTEIKETIRVH